MSKFPESALAHKYLDGLNGVEIGGSAHNGFGIKGCRNVDWTAEHTLAKADEVKLCGEFLPVDIVADAAALPFNDASLDYVISSHQIEHHWDPIGVLKEWRRVVRPGGYLFIVVPHKDRCEPDNTMPTTTLAELEARHRGDTKPPDDYPGMFYAHRSFWNPEAFREVLYSLALPVVDHLSVDDKVGNGFTFVCQKPERKENGG